MGYFRNKVHKSRMDDLILYLLLGKMNSYLSDLNVTFICQGPILLWEDAFNHVKTFI